MMNLFRFLDVPTLKQPTHLVHFDVGLSAADVRLQVGGVRLHGVGEHLDGAVVVADFEKVDETEVDVRHRHVLVQLQHRLEVGDRVFVSAAEKYRVQSINKIDGIITSSTHFPMSL